MLAYVRRDYTTDMETMPDLTDTYMYSPDETSPRSSKDIEYALSRSRPPYVLQPGIGEGTTIEYGIIRNRRMMVTMTGSDVYVYRYKSREIESMRFHMYTQWVIMFTTAASLL